MPENTSILSSHSSSAGNKFPLNLKALLTFKPPESSVALKSVLSSWQGNFILEAEVIHLGNFMVSFVRSSRFLFTLPVTTSR